MADDNGQNPTPGFGVQALIMVGALAACGVGFLLLDIVLMNMQGLELIFEK